MSEWSRSIKLFKNNRDIINNQRMKDFNDPRSIILNTLGEQLHSELLTSLNINARSLIKPLFYNIYLLKECK